MDIVTLALIKKRLAAKANLINGKIPADELPSYVDDVIEYPTKENFPTEGESSKIYVALDTGFTYRWSGSEYTSVGMQVLKMEKSDSIPITDFALVEINNVLYIAEHYRPQGFGKHIIRVLAPRGLYTKVNSFGMTWAELLTEENFIPFSIRTIDSEETPQNEKGLYRYTETIDGAQVSSHLVEVVKEEHEGGDVVYEKTTNSNNSQVNNSTIYNHFDAELTNYVTFTGITNAYTFYNALASGIRLGTGKAIGSVIISVPQITVVNFNKYFSYNSSTGVVTYDAASKVIIDGSAYEFEADDATISVELETGSHTIQSYIEEQEDPETGEITKIPGRILLMSFTVQGEPYEVFHKKELARTEEVEALAATVDSNNTTITNRVSDDEGLISHNAAEIARVDGKIGDVQIYEASRSLPSPGLEYLNKIYRLKGKLYQCVQIGEGVHKDFVFDVSGTSILTDANIDTFIHEVSSNFDNFYEWGGDLNKAYRNNGNLKLGSSSATGVIDFRCISRLPVTSLKIGIKAYNNNGSNFNIELDDGSSQEFFIDNSTDETIIDLATISSALDYLRIETVNQHEVIDPETGESVSVYNDRRGLVTRIIADFGEATYEWKEIHSPMIEITYQDLKALRNTNHLIPGQQYHIIDYVTTTNGRGCTDPSIITSSAEHQFDIIVTANTTNTLNENARVCVHLGDTYFGKEAQNIVSANWENPDIQPEDIEILGVLNDREEFSYKESHDSAKIITALTMLPNVDGVSVPAMFNPDPEESGNDCYYIYDGTFSVIQWVNDLVSVQGTINDDGEVLYEAGEYHPEDIFVELGYEEINGIMTPVLYKNELDKPEYIEEGPDYYDRFIYIGNFELDGVTYNRWNKEAGGADTGYQVLTQIIVVDNQFTITQEQLTNAIHSTTIVYDKWQELGVNGSAAPGFQSYWHLTEHLVDANILTNWVEKYKLSAWKIQYCIDNDSNRFAWADPINGKGVIYRMIDEWNNDLPYDFKNILYSINNNARYTFDNKNEVDLSLTGDCNNNKIGELKSDSSCAILNYILFGYNCRSNTFDGNCNHNIFGDGCSHNIFGTNCYFNIFGNSCSSNTFGDNCNNNAFGNNCHSNTFSGSCNLNRFGDNCSSSIFGYGCYSNTFVISCYFNTFGHDCYSNTFGSTCYSNTFGNHCYSNSFSNSCSSNSFGNSCSSNVLGFNCSYNIFGDECSSNTLGDQCLSNTFGYGYYFNTFGDSCNNNTFGNNCNSNTFGNDCNLNTFGNNCNLNIFGIACGQNTFGNYCGHNTFDNGCSYNIFSYGCSYITFGYNCHFNTFGGNCQHIAFDGKCYWNILDGWCTFMTLTSQDQSDNWLQYIHIHSGISGTDESNKLTITESRGLNHTVDYYASGSEEKYI